MKRIIGHWAVTRYKATALAKKHYHKIVEGNGNIVKGKFPISANKVCRPGRYAAHTRGCNTDSIGISCASMYGAVSTSKYGDYPITKVQFEAMCKDMAADCKKYSIPVSRKTTLSHAEVERELGIKQKGKWDISVLPFAKLTGARECGDYMRKRIKFHMGVSSKPENPDRRRKRWLQKLLSREGFPVTVDGLVGSKTKLAIRQFQEVHGLKNTGAFDGQTVTLLRHRQGV